MKGEDGHFTGGEAMSYKPDTIAKMVLNRLNDTHLLPAIQREFVWKPEQIEGCSTA